MGGQEASVSPIFGVSYPGVHFSGRFFLVGLPHARLTGSPPGKPRPCPRRLVVPLYYHCTIRVKHIPCAIIYGEYPIFTSLIFLPMYAIPLLPFQPSMLSNAYFQCGCIFCKPSCYSHAGQTSFVGKRLSPLHSGSSSSRPRRQQQARICKTNTR